MVIFHSYGIECPVEPSLAAQLLFHMAELRRDHRVFDEMVNDLDHEPSILMLVNADENRCLLLKSS